MICFRKPVCFPVTFLSITSKSTQFSKIKSSSAYATALSKISATLGSVSSLLNSPPKLSHNVLAWLVFCLITGQLPSVWFRVLPRYLTVATTSTIASSSYPHSMSSISPHLLSIYTSLCLIRISINLLHLYVRLLLIILAAAIFIPQWLYIARGSVSSCRIFTIEFQCQHTKCSLSLPGLFDFSGHLSTIHATNLSTCVSGTLHVFGPPPPTSIPCYVAGLFCVPSPCDDRGRTPTSPSCTPCNLLWFSSSP